MSILPKSVLLLGLVSLWGGEYGFEKVRPELLPTERKDVPDIWILGFEFRGPRYIQANIPASGRQTVWYMTYKITNDTGQPRTFFPKFTLVTDKGQVYQDEILPVAQRAVAMREDPTRIKPLEDSVSISREPISPSEKDAVTEVRRGVAFWRHIDLKAKAFTIYVTGLSNGYVKRIDSKTNAEELLRKTLVLEFTKPGDTIYDLTSEKEIHFIGGHWEYR